MHLMCCGIENINTSECKEIQIKTQVGSVMYMYTYSIISQICSNLYAILYIR